MPMSQKIRNLVYTCPVDHLGTSVFVKGWISGETPQQSVILVHDLGETAEDFDGMATKLVNSGFNVYSFDQRGHGQSGRRLGHIPSFRQLSLDLLQVAAWVRHQENTKPFIIGQGMGALVAMFFTKSYAKFCQGVVLASPLVGTIKPVRPFHRLILRSLADFFPTFILPNFLCPVFTSGKQKKGKPVALVGALLANELLVAISQARKLLMRQQTPTLLICANNDTVCRYESFKKLLAKQTDKNIFTLQFIEGETHRLLTEDEKNFEQVYDTLTSWLRRFNEQDIIADT
mgnify:CR=1 FL=1